MYEYTRSDFLRALLNQKKALNANSNSLVNPSLPQADNIANLAALNTSFSGTTSTPAPENVDTERNDWQRTIDTAKEFGSNITEGVLGFLDGISDAIAYGYGAISGDQSGALDWMNYDWQAQTLNALNQLDLAGNVATGDIFSKDYWDNWQTVGSAAQSRDQINRLHQNSWTSELGENQQMYNAITQGIGSALPSIVLGIVTGGMSSVAQAAITMGTMGVSAFGGGAAEALNDGASYGQAAAYGGVSAGIEMLTETISGTIGGVATSFLKKGQQKVVKEVAEEGFKKIAKATIKEMMSEGLEETVSTLANPLAKAATYKGTEAFKEYGTPDLWIEAAVSFASGALGGGVGSTASRVHLTNTYSKQGLQALDALNNANEIEKEYVKRISSGESVETLSEEYGVEYSNNIKKAVEIIQKMQKSDTAHYTKLMEAITGNSSKTTSINEYDEIVEKGLKPRVDETITQRYAKNIGSRIGVDINLVEDSMLQNAEAFMKATGIELTQEQIQQFNDPTTVKKGLNIDGKVYISDAYQNDINQLIMHEAISHGYLDSNKELRESLMMSITSNGKLLTKLKEIKDETYKAYGLDKIQVLKDLDARKTSASDVHASETVAKFLEFLYSNNDISSVLNSLNKSKLSAMLSRAIRYLGTKGDSTKQARLKLEKALAKLKGTNVDKDLKFAKVKATNTASTPTQATEPVSSKERLNFCESYSKKILKENKKPVLAYTCNDQIANRQIFTDSFFLVSLTKVDELPIPDYKTAQEKRTYPPVEPLFNKVEPYKNSKRTFTYPVKEVLELCKQAKANKMEFLHLVNEKQDFEACVNPDYLKRLIMFLNLKKNDTLTLHQSENSSNYLLYTKNDNGSEGIVMGGVLEKIMNDERQLYQTVHQQGNIIKETKPRATETPKPKVEKTPTNVKTNVTPEQTTNKPETKNVKIEVKSQTTSTQTTNTTPTNTPKPASYYDYFNPNGTIKSSVVNRVAKANLGKTISTTDSKFIVGVALQAIENTLGMSGNLSLDDFTTVARTFFEQYNLNDGKFYRSKAYNNLIEKLLDTTITYETTIEVDGKKQKIKSKTTLRAFIQADPVNSGFNSVDEFKTTFTQFIDEMIEHYGKPTKLQKAFDKFNQKIKETTDRLEEYTYTTTQNAKLTYETAKLSKQISEDFRDKKIKSYVGIEIPEISLIRNLIKSINPDAKFLTITSHSIDKLIQQFEAIDYRKDSPTLEKLGIEFNQDWYDMIDYFIEHRVSYIHTDKETGEKTIKKQFPKRALTLDETQMLHTFMKQVKELLKDIKSGKEQEMRKMFSKGTTNIRMVLNRTDTNKNSSNLLKRELDYVTSPDVMIGETFGFNSEIKKICFDDLLEAYINQQGAEQKFIDKFNYLAKKLKGKNKLSKKVEIEWNGTKYTVENDILVDIYLHSLATENRKVLLKKGYTFTYKGKERTIKFNEEMITELESKLTPELKEFASSISDYYNKELKAYAKKHGIDVLENVVYYPRTRSDVSNTQTDNLMQKFKSLNPDTLPINQQRKNQGNNPLAGMGASARIKSYINQVTKIGELTKALDIYSKFLNTKVYYKGNMVSRNELIKHINKDWTTWKEYIENQVAGIPVSNEVKKSGLFQNLIASTLGLNISTVLKQTASIPTIMTNVHLSSFLKGVFDIKNTTKTSFTYKKIKAILMEESPLLYKRFSENQVILAQGLTKQLGKISKAVMLPIEAMDEGIILTFCYQTAYYEAEFLLSKNGTPTKDEIHKKAIKILERIVLNTQSNSVAPKMSMARAGAKGYMRKALSVFTADLNNIVNIWREVISSRKVALKNIESIEQMIKQTKSDLETIPQEIRDEIAQKTKLLNGLSGKEKTKMENIIQKLEEKLQSETNRLTLELDNLNKLLEENKVNADLGDKTKQLLKLLFVMALKGVTIAAIGQLVDRLYGRKDWDENTILDFAKVAILESTIYNIPYVQTFVSAMEFDQPVGGFEFTQINDTLSLITDVIEELNKDNPNYYSLAYKFATTIGQFTGIPFKNIYNIVMGVWKNTDPNGHEWDAIIKGYSDSYILQQYKEATKVGRDYQAKGYFDLLMKTNKVSVYSDKVQNEIISFSKDDYNAMPKNFMQKYTDENDIEIYLTEDQIKMFRTAYNESNKDVEGLLNVTEYKTLTQEEKAKLVKKIYDTYYAYAKAKVLKQEKASNKLATLLLYSDGKANISKYVNVLSKIESIKETETKTRKELVIEYVNKLKGYSHQEKLLIIRLAGYKVKGSNEIALTNYLKKTGFNKEQIGIFLDNVEEDKDESKDKILFKKKG